MPSLSGSFTIPLDLDATPEQVWPFFAELPLRKKWVRMPGPSSTATHEFDLRVGGGERLISSYEAAVAGILRWVALVTVELAPNDEGGTHLEWTEQYSFAHLSTPGGVDDVKHLIGGTRLRLNGLVAAVAASGGPS